MRPQTSRASWKQVSVILMGVFLLILGLGCLQLSVTDGQMLAVADEYIDAELEITKYHLTEDEGRVVKRRGRSYRASSSNRRNAIEGVIHPGGIPVYTNDHDVSLSVLDQSDSIVVDQPLRQEVEGQRVPVLYWTGDPAARRWYHPPIVTTTSRPSLVRTSVLGLVCLGALVGSVACFRYGMRRTRRLPAVATIGRPRRWPEWTVVCVTGCVLTWPFLVLVVMAMMNASKMNKTGTARLPLTTGDWVARGFAILMAGIIPLACTVGLVVAVRRRLAYRSNARLG